MSAKLTEIQLVDGSSIMVQYEEIEDDELHVVSFDKNIENVAERVIEWQKKMNKTTKFIVESIIENIPSNSSGIGTPKSICVEFGLQFGGETGIPFLAKGTATANIKIAATWELKKD